MPSTHSKDELHRFLKTGMRLWVNFEFSSEEKYSYAATYIGLKEKRLYHSRYSDTATGRTSTP